MGIISQSEMGGVKNELYSRRLVLDLAKNRVKLLDELRQMAVEEQRMEMPTLKNSMIRYDGTVAFRLADLPAIEREFKVRFHHDLPVSAIGQTLVHQGMGLDHRNKVDVALNPEQPEGLWLRQYLEKQHVSVSGVPGCRGWRGDWRRIFTLAAGVRGSVCPGIKRLRRTPGYGQDQVKIVTCSATPNVF